MSPWRFTITGLELASACGIIKGHGDTFDRIKQIQPDVKILLSSGYSLDGQVAAIRQRGCAGFIQKPFNIESLSAKIREILQ